MRSSPLADSERAALIGVLLSDPALADAERFRDSSEHGIAVDDPGSLSFTPSNDDFQGSAGVNENEDFLGLLDDPGPGIQEESFGHSIPASDPDTDEFPAITDPAETGQVPAGIPGTSAEESGEDEDPDPDEEGIGPRAGRASAASTIIDLRSPRTWIIAASVIILVFLALSALSRGDGAEDSPVMLSPAPAEDSAGEVSGDEPGIVRDGPIEVDSATSRCPAGSSDPMLAFDGSMESAWVCVRAWEVDGQILEIDLGDAYEISQIGLVPGWNRMNADGSDEWIKHRSVSRATYSFNDVDRSTWSQDTGSRRELVMSDVSAADGSPVIASHVTITIEETRSTSGQQRSGGSDQTDFAISEIRIIGRPAQGKVEE